MKRIFFIIVLFLALISTQLGAQENKGDNALSHFIHASALFNSNNIDSAYFYIKKSLEMDETNDAAWFLLSRIASEKYEHEYSNLESITNDKKKLLRNIESDIVLGARKCYELDKNNPNYIICYSYFINNDEDKTKLYSILERGIEHNKTSEDLYKRLFDYCIANNNPQKAEEVALKFIENNGKNQMGYYLLQMAYNVEGKSEEAIKVLLEASEAFPSTMWDEYLAGTYLSIAKDSLAEVYYDKILSYDPSSINAIYGKIDITLSNNRPEEFCQALGKYLALENVDIKDKFKFVKDLINYRDFFIANIDKIFDTVNDFYHNNHDNPNAPEIINWLSQLKFFSDKEKAIEVIQEGLNNHPYDYDLISNYLYYLQSVSRFDQIISETNKYLQEIKSSKKEVDEKIVPLLLHGRGYAEYSLKQYDKNIETFNELAKYAKKNKNNDLLLEAYAGMGDIWEVKGNAKKAYSYYDKVLKIDPMYCPTLNNYAYSLAKEKKKSSLIKAEKMSRITIQQEPGNSTYLDTYAYILYKMGAYQEAKKYYQKAIAYEKDLSSTIVKHYAECLYALEEYDLARDNYLTAFRMALEENDTKEQQEIIKEVKERGERLKLKVLEDGTIAKE